MGPCESHSLRPRIVMSLFRISRERPSLLENQELPKKKLPLFKGVMIFLFNLMLVNAAFYYFSKDQNFFGPEPVHKAELLQVMAETAVLPAGSAIPAQSIAAPGLNFVEQFEPRKVSWGASPRIFHPGWRTLKLKVKNSLSFSVCRKIAQPDCVRLTAHIARLLAWFVDIHSEVRPGDSLHIIYKMIEGPEHFRILKLVYDSGYLKKKFEINFFKAFASSSGSYFEASGKEAFPRLKKTNAPIHDYSEITSLPGDFRKGKVRGHRGTDFKAPVGTPLFASFDARVTRVNWNREKNGYCIELDHPAEGVKTLYLHLDKVRVRRGQYVKQGERIGDSGNTGRSFAPHLHYEVNSRGPAKTVYNPFTFKYHKKYRRRIPQQSMAEYQKAVDLYEAHLSAS